MKKLILLIMTMFILLGCKNHETKKSTQILEPTLETHGWKYMIRGAKKIVFSDSKHKQETFLYPSGNKKIEKFYSRGKLKRVSYYEDLKTFDGRDKIVKIIRYKRSGKVSSKTQYTYDNNRLIEEAILYSKKNKKTAISKFSYPTIKKDLIIRKSSDVTEEFYFDNESKLIKEIREEDKYISIIYYNKFQDQIKFEFFMKNDNLNLSSKVISSYIGNLVLITYYHFENDKVIKKEKSEIKYIIKNNLIIGQKLSGNENGKLEIIY